MTSIEANFLSYTHGIPCEYELFIPEHININTCSEKNKALPCLWFFPPCQGNFKTWSGKIQLEKLLKNIEATVLMFNLEEEQILPYLGELKEQLEQIFSVIQPESQHFGIVPIDRVNPLEGDKEKPIFRKLWTIDSDQNDYDALETSIEAYIKEVDLWRY